MIDDLSILGPAFVAGLLVLATHVPLGRRVLERGIIFIDIAIAQFASLGVILAHIIDVESAWMTQAAAFAAALGGAALLNLSERLWPEVQEAIIGSSFVVVASLVILLLAHDPHGGEELHELLVGQILWTGWGDLVPLAGISLLVLTGWFGFGLQRSQPGFYLLFALAVTMSVQIVGVYLVFASLILPALATRRSGVSTGLALGYAVGTLGYAAGLLLSLRFDLPSGAIIVCALALSAAASLLRLKAPPGQGDT